MQEDDLFPVLVYEYNEQGRYGEPERLFEPGLQAYFKLKLRKVLNEKRELRITDMGDRMVFHVRDGKILYDGENHYPNGKPIPPEKSQP